MPLRARRPPLSIRLPRRAFSARSSAAAATTATSTPATPLRLLIVEAYDRAGRERLTSAGCTAASDTFAALLSRICPEDHELRLSYCHPADSVHELAEVGELSRFDGVVWTGSSLTIHEDKPEVTRQIELARRCFQAAVPQYGSCWGLQISAAAAGIPCEPNPRGREHGIARGIALTRSGRRHPMFDGCLQTFDGCAAHTDHVAASWAAAPVCRPGVEAEVLASNDFTPVQGLAVRIDGGEFWSVQYHPELDLGEIARLMRLPASRSLLVEQGEYSSEEELLRYSRDLEALAADPSNLELRRRLAVGDDVIDPARRAREIANWLQHLVLPQRRRDLDHVRGPRAEARYPPPGLAGSQLVGAAGRVGEPLGAPAARPGEVVVDNPYDGSEAARVRLLGASEAVAQAVAAARVQREWAAETTVAERVELCGRFLDALEADVDRVAADITAQMGKPLAASRGEVRGVRERAEAMMALAPASLAPEQLPEKPSFTRRIEKVPVGVVLAIAPWNYPLLTAVNCVVPAVLAGNAVQLKHSPRTPLCADAFERAFAAAGAPAGLVQALPCSNEAVHAAIELPQVGLVSFTGSVKAGHAVHASASRRFIDTTLELGGKDGAYVAADADVAAAAASLVDGAFYNAGQSCCAIERVYVHETVHEEFVARALELVRAYRLGDPRDGATSLGPLALPSAPAFLRGQVLDATAKGARLLCGGVETACPATGRGRFFAPALLDGCDHSMALMRDESFGPVLGVCKVASDAEAAEAVDDSPFGLTACIFTSDVERAEAFAARVDVGTVFMNRCDYLDPLLPWTGAKASGKGASLSAHGFKAFTRLKGVHFKHDPLA